MERRPDAHRISLAKEEKHRLIDPLWPGRTIDSLSMNAHDPASGYFARGDAHAGAVFLACIGGSCLSSPTPGIGRMDGGFPMNEGSDHASFETPVSEIVHGIEPVEAVTPTADITPVSTAEVPPVPAAEVPPVPTGEGPPPRRRTSRKRLFAAIGAAVAVALIVSVAAVALSGGGAPAAKKSSGETTNTTPPAPPLPLLAPAGLSAEGAPFSVTLTWTLPSGGAEVIGYKVYRDGVLVGTVSSPSTTFEDTDVLPGGSYSYGVLSRGAGVDESDRASVQ